MGHPKKCLGVKPLFETRHPHVAKGCSPLPLRSCGAPCASFCGTNLQCDSSLPTQFTGSYNLTQQQLQWHLEVENMLGSWNCPFLSCLCTFSDRGTEEQKEGSIFPLKFNIAGMALRLTCVAPPLTKSPLSNRDKWRLLTSPCQSRALQIRGVNDPGKAEASDGGSRQSHPTTSVPHTGTNHSHARPGCPSVRLQTAQTQGNLQFQQQMAQS